MPAYLSTLADSDLFGSLALLSIVVAMSGLFRGIRSSKLYFPATFICLLFMPILHALGSYFLSNPHP